MPSKGNKALLVELVVYLGLSQKLIPQLSVMKEEQLLLLLALLENGRYTIPRNPVPKSTEWIRNVLSNVQFDDLRFRSQMRMDRSTFNYLVGLLQDNPAFGLSGEPVPLQIAVALYRFGHFGNSASLINVATKFGISEGSVSDFTTRTMNAILNIANNWITWPNDEEKNRINQEMTSKCFPKNIGFVDGSDADLFAAPVDDKEVYWSRKKKYCIQFQVVCDSNRKILHFTTGFPGSVHDSKVYTSTALHTDPDRFFGEGEYLIGDSAYPKSNTLITPYKKPHNGTLSVNEKKFNRHMSSYRVTVEHTIGMMKGRFSSLQGLRVIVNKDGGHERACKWIYCQAVLHNILLSIDPWTQETDEMYCDLLEYREINQGVVDSSSSASGNDKREYLKDLICG